MQERRFNAPPGWPVPPDWSPGPDWEPDPGWPPAPPGWAFWGDTDADDVSGDAGSPIDGADADRAAEDLRPENRWRGVAVAGAALVVVVLVVIASTVAGPTDLESESASISLLPHEHELVPATGSPSWRPPGSGEVQLYLNLAKWTRFGGIDARYSEDERAVQLDTHDTTETWRTKWSGIISGLTTTCATRIVGRVRDTTHHPGVAGGFGIGLGTMSSGDPTNADLSGTAIQFDFGQGGYRIARYPADTDIAHVPAKLDRQWHDVEVLINQATHALIVDGVTVLRTPRGGQCGHPFLRVWAGAAEFSKFTVS